MSQHQDASVKSCDATQNNSTYPDTSAGQVAQGSAKPPTSEDKDEVGATLFFQWSDGDKKKDKKKLEKALQSWANKCNFNGDCTVLDVSEDGRAEIKIKPAEAVSKLGDLQGKTLNNRDGDKVTITTVTLRGMKIHIPDKVPVNLAPSVSDPQDVKGQFRERSLMNTSTSNVLKPTDIVSVNLTSSSVSEPQHVKGQLGEKSHMNKSPSDVLKPMDNASLNPPSSVSEQQHNQEPPVGQASSSSSTAVSTREEKTGCVLPVVQFWFMNNIFKEDIKHIERRHGVKMNAEVNVTFVGNQKDEGLKEALSEFTDLVQKHLGDFDGSVTPLKSVDTVEFKDTLKMIQRPEHKLLVSLSSDEMTIYGPRPIPTTISKFLNAAKTSSANTYNSAAESQVTSLNNGMSVNDHLVKNGLTIQESHWKLMTTSFSDDIDKIKDKFGVDFKDSGVRQGKVNIKAYYKRSGGNTSMESHAIRALLHLCQKIATSPKNIIQHQGATGFNVSAQKSSSVYPSEGVSSGPVVNIQSGYSTRNTEAKEQGQHQYATGNFIYPAPNNLPNPYTSAGQFPQTYQYTSVIMPTQGQHQYAMGNFFYPAKNNLPYPNISAGQFLQTNPSVNMPTVSSSAGDNEDEQCPICKDTFNNKKQLKCKHEFCEECLEQSKKHMGPVCPVCKDVFGVIEGTQPDGTMSSYQSTLSLPGFEDCGTIVIDYYIPSGKQTERHPNPGQHYHGTSRTAYLPDNKEGREVLRLLKKAFNQKLIFTVGTSTTTGIENQVTWNNIHHKTSMTGGPQRFGYPDPDYLRRVRDELKAKGIE